ncbi:uncharacterized protein N7479_001251 [Penicillium vulpinum]|uniref:Uncharacterized protein n=1 Tax=Penicillium vulpinum TaxID=29845 RepID=A0A1V6S039_9EURO|nr:uncharacterized protein N7479_001251 [Penicillium vulpinum]KAJ5971333.1 hypothetical protein N7479_001251 [Penicillium vulpinum]OQE07119.1 hypothetical protein PENVUL_c015G01847 [Penicillium vulpinum]
MRHIVSVLRRPRALPQITLALVWVSHEEIESLVNATETLEIKRREPGMKYTARPTTGAATTPSATQPEEKPAESIAEQTLQGQIYHIQTKTLDRPVHYISHVRLILLPPGLQFIASGVQDLAPGIRVMIPRATTASMPLLPVLPLRFLREILISENSPMTATQSLGHVLAGVDQFAGWKSGWSEVFLWWLTLLRPYWYWVALALFFLLLLILVSVLPG